MSSKEQLVQMSLSLAKQWEKKGDPNWASRNYETALFAILSEAVAKEESEPTVVTILRGFDAPFLLERFIQLNSAVVGQVAAGILPWSVIGGNYHLVVLAHMASLLKDHTNMTKLVSLAVNPEVVKLSTPFWAAYALAFHSFLEHRSFQLPTFRLRGQEKYWLVYINTMKQLLEGESPTNLLSELHQTFQKRNNDKRIKDDPYEIEGSSFRPVAFDFRAASILAIAEERRRAEA